MRRSSAAPWPSSRLLHPQAAQARLLKSTLVRIPQSVYRARPGHDQYRPDQATPVPNFYLCGDYTRQEYLASMEGAVLSGKRVAERIVAGTRMGAGQWAGARRRLPADRRWPNTLPLPAGSERWAARAPATPAYLASADGIAAGLPAARSGTLYQRPAAPTTPGPMRHYARPTQHAPPLSAPTRPASLFQREPAPAGQTAGCPGALRFFCRTSDDLVDGAPDRGLTPCQDGASARGVGQIAAGRITRCLAKRAGSAGLGRHPAALPQSASPG